MNAYDVIHAKSMAEQAERARLIQRAGPGLDVAPDLTTLSDSAADLNAGPLRGWRTVDPTQAPQPPKPFFDALGHRIATLDALLGDTDGTLSDLRDRVFGSSKLANGIGANAPKDAASSTEVALSVLDGLITRARVVLDHAQVLNSRL